MKKPVLIIMAAGMGSRYGGLKQIDPVDQDGHIIMDFSIYDAVKAGFEKVIFIIKKENEQDFRETIGDRMAQRIEVEYVFQDIAALPDGFAVPEGRVKPWGTAHAVLSCLSVVDGPFAVINADDYYGQQAFRMIYDYLASHEDTDKYQYTMVGYLLENTLTENGHVARGVCETNADGKLAEITERKAIYFELLKEKDRYRSTKHNGNGIGLASITATAEKHGGSARFSNNDREFFADVVLRI